MPADYDALSAVLDVATERLGRAWGAVGHLNAVADTPALRAAYTAALPRVTEFYTRLGADERLYAKYKAMLASPAAARLSPARRRALDNAVRDFVLSGAELQGADKARFAEIQARQAELTQKFSEHVLDATDGYAYDATAAELDGVPADVVEAARAAAEAAAAAVAAGAPAPADARRRRRRGGARPRRRAAPTASRSTASPCTRPATCR